MSMSTSLAANSSPLLNLPSVVISPPPLTASSNEAKNPTVIVSPPTPIGNPQMNFSPSRSGPASVPVSSEVSQTPISVEESSHAHSSKDVAPPVMVSTDDTPQKSPPVAEPSKASTIPESHKATTTASTATGDESLVKFRIRHKGESFVFFFLFFFFFVCLLFACFLPYPVFSTVVKPL